MKPYREKVRGGRALLNGAGHQTTAAIVAEIEDTRPWPKGRIRGGRKIGTDLDGKPSDEVPWELFPNVTLQIANCDRSIAFELDYETPDDLANNLHKVDTMIAVLSEFRAALADEQERFARRLAKHRKG